MSAPTKRIRLARLRALLRVHGFCLLLFMVLVPAVVGAIAGPPHPWMADALEAGAGLGAGRSVSPESSARALGAPLAVLLYGLQRSTQWAAGLFGIALALSLWLTLLLLVWTLTLRIRGPAARAGGLAFLVMAAALGIGRAGAHPLILPLLPLMGSIALVAAFAKQGQPWQPALAGALSGVTAALDLRALGVAAGLIVFLARLNAGGWAVSYRSIRGLGAFVGGLLLAAAILGIVAVPAAGNAWLLHFVAARVVGWGSVLIAPRGADALTIVFGVMPLLLLLSAEKLARPAGGGSREQSAGNALSRAVLLGGSAGVFLGGRFGAADLLPLVPLVVLFAAPSLERSVLEPQRLRFSGWGFAVIVLLLPLWCLQASSAVWRLFTTESAPQKAATPAPAQQPVVLPVALPAPLPAPIPAAIPEKTKDTPARAQALRPAKKPDSAARKPPPNASPLNPKAKKPAPAPPKKALREPARRLPQPDPKRRGK